MGNNFTSPGQPILTKSGVNALFFIKLGSTTMMNIDTTPGVGLENFI